MRFDHITSLNTNLEQQAVLFEQTAAFHEHEASKLRAAARAMRQLASTDPQEGDPTIDARPFTLPGVAKPKTASDVLKEYGRSGAGGVGGVVTGTLQNAAETKAEGAAA